MSEEIQVHCLNQAEYDIQAETDLLVQPLSRGNMPRYQLNIQGR
jgi:hypothetical protein